VSQRQQLWWYAPNPTPWWCDPPPPRQQLLLTQCGGKGCTTPECTQNAADAALTWLNRASATMAHQTPTSYHCSEASCLGAYPAPRIKLLMQRGLEFRNKPI
jgi:hypothetical protein